LLIAALGLPAIAAADDAKKTPEKAKPMEQAKLSPADLAIVAHLHHVNQMEIDMGKMAQKQGTAAVKKYGDMLVTDHSTADKNLLAMAKARGITTIPEDKPATEADKQQHQKQMEKMAKLKTLKGADFDREFLPAMVEGHEGELTKTEPSIAMANDQEVKKTLENRKPSLQRHADNARELLKNNPQATNDKMMPPAKMK
jgi:putative membrane protein